MPKQRPPPRLLSHEGQKLLLGLKKRRKKTKTDYHLSSPIPAVCHHAGIFDPTNVTLFHLNRNWDRGIWIFSLSLNNIACGRHAEFWAAKGFIETHARCTLWNLFKPLFNHVTAPVEGFTSGFPEHVAWCGRVTLGQLDSFFPFFHLQPLWELKEHLGGEVKRLPRSQEQVQLPWLNPSYLKVTRMTENLHRHVAVHFGKNVWLDGSGVCQRVWLTHPRTLTRSLNHTLAFICCCLLTLLMRNQDVPRRWKLFTCDATESPCCSVA